MPSEITFEDGHSIANVYSADGQKLKSSYKTRIYNVLDPTENTRRPQVTLGQNGIPVLDPSQIVPKYFYEGYGTHYVGNIEYEFEIDRSNESQPVLKRISNAEGYVADNQYFYYRRDHLGNNREVWNATQNQTAQITNYYPSGLPWKTTQAQHPDLQPYKYNGKEFVEDYGYDVFDYGARGYYAAIGRFTSIDPLAEKYYSWSPYCYTLGNPIRFIDIKGLAPGDPFKTITAAAKDWGMYYNGASILREKEFGSTIYIIRENGKVIGYSYSVATEGRAHGVETSSPPNLEKVVADIHSHGNDDIDFDDNNFSGTDKHDNNKKNIDGFLVTPNGSLKKYDVKTRKETTISTDMPSDPNDPDRKNKNTPTDIPMEKKREQTRKEQEQEQKPNTTFPEPKKDNIIWAF